VTSIYGNDSTHLNQPWDVAVNGDSVTAVADKGFMVPIFPNPPLLGQRVQVYSDFNDSLASRTYGVSGQAGLDAVHLAFPHGVGISGTGAVFVADTFNNRVVEFDNDGNGVADLIINPSGQPGGGQFQLAGPMDVDADSSGEIYVADTGNHRVQLFNPNGMYQGTIGETGVNLSDAFHLNWPAGIKTSADGQIYIADSGNNRVLRITPARLTMGSVERLDAPENVDIDIGADGSPDWSFGGVLVGKVRTAELAPAVNSALAGLPNVTDQYGIGMVLLTLNVSNARTGRLVLSNLTIIYDCAVDVPDFAAAVTMYVTAHAGEAKPAGNVSVPVVYTAASAGGVRLGGLDLLADFPPDLVAAVPDRALDEETAELALYNFSDFFSDDFDAVLDFSLVDPTNYTIADIRIVNRSILSVDCTGAAARLWHGSIDFRVKATDSRGLSAVSNPVRVTVRQMNHAPRITSSPPSLAARVGREWSYSVEAVDADGDALNFSLAQAPAGMGIDALSGQILWTPAAGQEGAAEVDVRATDGLLSDEQGFFVNVTNGTGRPPVITSTPAAVAEIGIEYTYQVTAADDGNATLSYSLDLFPEGMTIGNASGLVRWTPEARQAGANEVAVRVSNPQLSATQTFNVTVGEHAGVMPTITIAEPAPNATVRGTVWLRGIAYAGVGSVELVEVSLDGSGRWEPATGKSAWAYRLDTTRLSNGPHQVNLRVRNTPGDTAQANLTINVDNPRSGTAGATITIFGLGLWLWITLIVIVIAVVGVAAYAATRKRPPPAPMQATYAPPPPVQASPAAFAPAPAASAAFAPAAAPPAASASPAPAAVAAARAQAPAPPQRPLQRTVAVDSVFLIYHDGRLITYFSRSESIKLDDTLDMIRKFVKASFAGQLGRLDSMRYENMSIIMERGNLMYMVVITPMSGHDRLRREMRCLLEEINSRYRVTFKIWDGDFNRVKGVKTMIEKFAGEEVEEAPGQKDEAVPAAPRPAQEAPSEPAPAGPYGPAAGVEEPRRSAPPPPSETGTEPPKTSAAALTEAERLRLLEDRFLRGEITELTYTELRKKLTKK
jgi:sugar lactone lactonase YvrE